MNFTARRTCKVVDQGHGDKPSDAASAPLGDFAQSRAYVLIGEPGAGKTTAFETEADSQSGLYLSVRDFLAYDEKPEWRDATLFLDGLDEARAGAIDGRTPLDRVRAKLDRLGSPRFRLSCRWADWLGDNDRDRLGQVSGGAVTVLQLDPLSEREIKRILAENHGIADPAKFIADAREHGVHGLLRNPQNLDMLATAVSGGDWPGSRRETFEEACRMLVSEPNSEHSVVNPAAGKKDKLLDEAGRLCAVQLLAGHVGFTLLDNVPAHPDYPPAPAVGSGMGPSRVLWSRLFAGTSEGRLVPAHRQIAEFLTARHVSALLDDGLPLDRVLALVTGFDGELVEPFQYFIAWLGVHHRPSRPRLSAFNPSGLFYAGDRGTFSTEERRTILVDLRREARWNPWCLRSMRRTGLGPLVSADLKEELAGIVSASDRGYPHQPHVMMLLQALCDGTPLPGLVPEVHRIVRDPSWLPGLSYGGFNVPVEIKRSCHRELWTAVRTQLVSKYLRDPEAEGFGIYLVIWFGEDSRCRPTPLEGWVPSGARDVKFKLTELLSEKERSKIAVCIVDVCRPGR